MISFKSLLPSAEFDKAQEKTARNIFWTVCIGTIFLAILLPIIVWSLEGASIIINVKDGKGEIFTDPFARAMELFLVAISIVIGALVFIWSWFAYVNSKQSRELLDQSWQGRQVVFESIADHIKEFGAEMSGGNISDITEIRLMLSTLVYGILDEADGPGTIRKFISILDDWVDRIPEFESRRRPLLKLSLWGLSDHAKLWSTSHPDAGSDWYNKVEKQDSVEYLLAMKEMIDFFKKIQASGKIVLEVDFVAKNDFRFFIVKRSNTYFGMVVIFTTFDETSVKSGDYLNTGFITKSQLGVEQMESMIEKLHVQAPSVDSFPRDREFIESIDRYFKDFFGLELSETGVDWQKDPEEWLNCYNEKGLGAKIDRPKDAVKSSKAK